MSSAAGNKLNIGVVGCSGRMGRVIMIEILANESAELAGGTVRKGHRFTGKDVSEVIGGDPVGVPIIDDLEALFARSDAVIEFSQPELTRECAELAAKYKKILVSGTTGLTDEDRECLEKAANDATIIWSSNMSVGVNLMLALTKHAASILDADFDIEIVEMHHRNKVDAPSGTAISLGEAAAKGRGVSLEDVEKHDRQGITGKRPKGEIGFATLRGGDVIGDHTVIFSGEGERFELTHKSSNRSIYAKGAIRACLWGKDKKPGLYHMKDVLSETE